MSYVRFGNESATRLRRLPLRVKVNVVRARYGLLDGRQQKLSDIGKRHGISAERVRQLERQALATLRRIADPDLAA